MPNAPGQGRPRKPTKLHAIQGTAQKCRMDKRDGEPEYSDDIKRPEYLTPLAIEHWDNLAKILTGSGVLKESDVTALAMLCEELATWQAMNEAIANHGAVHKMEDDFGELVDTKTTSFYQVRNKAYMSAMKSLSLFGLTPSDRSRVIGDKEGKKTNPFDALAK